MSSIVSSWDTPQAAMSQCAMWPPQRVYIWLKAASPRLFRLHTLALCHRVLRSIHISPPSDLGIVAALYRRCRLIALANRRQVAKCLVYVLCLGRVAAAKKIIWFVTCRTEARDPRGAMARLERSTKITARCFPSQTPLPVNLWQSISAH